MDTGHKSSILTKLLSTIEQNMQVFFASSQHIKSTTDTCKYVKLTEADEGEQNKLVSSEPQIIKDILNTRSNLRFCHSSTAVTAHKSAKNILFKGWSNFHSLQGLKHCMEHEVTSL